MLPERSEGLRDPALVVEIEELAGDDEQQPVGQGDAQGVRVGVRPGPARVQAGDAGSEGTVERGDAHGARATDGRTPR